MHRTNLSFIVFGIVLIPLVFLLRTAEIGSTLVWIFLSFAATLISVFGATNFLDIKSHYKHAISIACSILVAFVLSFFF